MNQLTFFVDIILPLAVPNLYTYRIPQNRNDIIKVGQRVIVQFGKNKLYTALIRNIHQKAPTEYTAKYIEEVLDEVPIVSIVQFEFWEWLSSYYMCTIGEVMNAALPSGLKLASETQLVINPDFVDDYSELTDTELLIVETLEQKNTLSIKETVSIIHQKTVYPIIKSLIEKGAILIEEELKERYKPKMIDYVQLTKEADDDEHLKKIFDKLERAHKQLELLMAYIQLSERYSKNPLEVKKQDLLKKANATSTVLNQLIKKEIFKIYERQEGRLSASHLKKEKKKKLNQHQQQALEKIKENFKEKDVVLLHGVTSSGKTNIYIKLIEEALAEGKQVLYLLPEIALTTQIINRLQKHFGNMIGVYHSKFNENERVEVWNAVSSFKFQVSGSQYPVDSQHLENNNKNPITNHQSPTFPIILGARSAIFLPYSNLGLVIVDEEHENTYKQYDPAPRYHARDTAIMLAKRHHAKVLLGSATPSIETSLNAQNKKYGLVELTKRFREIQLPEIIVADLKEAYRKRQMKSHFSPLLLEEMQKTLDNKEQIILFRNRRGFAPLLQCQTCGWIPQCKHCDVSLTYHKHIHRLKCHYCGYSTKVPVTCNACGDEKLQMKGYGTEKIEEELAIFFPKARIARMDGDTTRQKYAYQKIINDFEERAVDILIGTQMVTKGLDFDNVALVGILNADSMLNFPDFRAFERSYQLMAQVAGRAGRKHKRGKVIIQTFNPYHAIIRNVIDNNYINMYQNEILDRKNFKYPPFCRLIRITLKHKNIDLINKGAKVLANDLRQQFGERILGPEFPAIARVRNQYYKNILLKIEPGLSVIKAKKILSELLILFRAKKDAKAVRIVIDVDPM